MKFGAPIFNLEDKGFLKNMWFLSFVRMTYWSILLYIKSSFKTKNFLCPVKSSTEINVVMFIRFG